MPLLPSDVHAVDVPLSNVSIAYDQTSGFVGGDPLFGVPVEQQSNRYYIWTKADWFRSEAQVRAPGTESAGGELKISSTTYTCNVIAYHEKIPVATTLNADASLRILESSARNITHKLALKREADFVTACMATSIWATDSTPGTLWSAAGSTPIADMRTGCLTIKQSTSQWPTDLFLSFATWNAIQDNSDFISRISFGTPSAPSIVSPNLLAQILGLKRVHILGSSVNGAVEGAAASMAFQSVKDALLCVLPDSPGLMTPSAFYRFDWMPYTDSQSIRMMREYDWKARADYLEGEMAYAFKVTATDLGYFFSNAVA